MLLTTATAWADTGDEADGVYYIGTDGKLKNTATDGIPGNDTPTALTGSETTLGTEDQTTWYVASGTVSFDHALDLADGADVHLILADGATMNVGSDDDEGRIADFGIAWNVDAALTIYGQTLGTGELSVYTTGNNHAGIYVSALTINGGTVTADANGDRGSALYALTDVTINGGTVSATCGSGIGIFGGTAVNIKGGIVNATGGDYGINSNNEITVKGGIVNATGGDYGICAAVMDGTDTDKKVTIKGGTVNASGGTKGIRADGDVTINGGTVTATGGIKANVAITLDGGIVNANSYEGTVILDGCDYRNADGSETITSGGDIANGVYNGKTIYPDIPVSYINENGVEQTVESEDYTILEGNPNGGDYLPDGTYVVCSNITYTSTVTLDGDVTLILTDGCTMNIGTREKPIYYGKGIDGYDDASLTIYGQTLGTGALSVYTTGGMNDAIIAKALTINGGNITANTDGNEAYALYAFTDVTINGGTVTATSDNGTGIAAGRGITLGWNKPTDRIYASSYDGTVTLKKLFTDADGNTYGGTLSNDALAALNALAASSDGLTLQPSAVSYIDEDGQQQTSNYYTVLTGSETTLPAGTYVAYGTVNYGHRLSLDDGDDENVGEFNLILCDGCTMNVGTSEARIDDIGITAEALTIYGQTLGTGALNVYTTGDDEKTHIGISTDALTINGGKVSANDNGAGDYALFASTNVTINGGTVIAICTGSNSTGIFGGDNVEINGGTVNASGSVNGICGIENATISGGTVNANGGEYGIYTSTALSNKTVTISGGNVTAKGGTCGIYASGTITLGWTYFSDRIYASSYDGTLVLAEGKTFIAEDGTPIDYLEGLNEAIANQTLFPDAAAFTLAANAHDGNYWTTFYCGYKGYEIADGENACAYTATVSGDVLTLHKLGKVIPKQTAVIIVGSDNSISMTASTGTVSTKPANSLHGVDVSTSVTEVKNYDDEIALYVMGKKVVNEEPLFGFFEYTGANMPASKAFLLIDEDGAALARGLTMVFADGNGSAGVSPATVADGDVRAPAWYTLDGRRLAQKPTKSGMYVANGRKVVIK